MNAAVWNLLLSVALVLAIGLATALLALPRYRGARPNRILAGLLVAMALEVGEYLLLVTGYAPRVPHLSNLPLQFAIPPLYYFFAVSLLNANFRWRPYHALHAIPLVLMSAWGWKYFAMPAARKAQILAVAPTYVWDVGVVDILFVLANTVQLFVYVTVVARMIGGLQERMKNACSGTALGHIAALRSINFAFYVVVAIQLAVYADCFVTGKYVVTKDYLLTFALGVVVYAVAYAALFQPESFVRCVETTPAHHPSGPPPVELPALRERLVEHMQTREPYRRPNLRLVDLADELGVPMHHLSYVINSQFEANFNDFINRFRVEEAQRRLRHADDQKFTLVAIAEDVGFTSRTSFNRAFKKLVGTTPTEYARAWRAGAQERPSV